MVALCLPYQRAFGFRSGGFVLEQGEGDSVHGAGLGLAWPTASMASGSPTWQDTVLVRPGEEVQVAFKAGNPGIWMDHCHNFWHSKIGMVMHLAYDNVTTPYEVGGPVGNKPE
ncbi:multicopper oxidase domain-containing protein [Streptomyces sp. BB1-1-1]|uniref:multicopper oxidase domain-containing protein n=1 Tax=Streptomyces sp. BB1-1-1 TaxID=3074430 RepID=UPI0028772B2F|nr:multicopper oxidase domain-containing protein [Streptomyces sp. BB1-1-1]WND32978.1 multicopper oxidase domain-containing protein [Streptomyces sp. BB1-1-1]